MRVDGFIQNLHETTNLPDDLNVFSSNHQRSYKSRLSHKILDSNRPLFFLHSLFYRLPFACRAHLLPSKRTILRPWRIKHARDDLDQRILFALNAEARLSWKGWVWSGISTWSMVPRGHQCIRHRHNMVRSVSMGFLGRK